MSISVRNAVAEFVPLLSKSQKLKLEANFGYTKGRFNYLEGNFAEAKKDLLFGMKYGFLTLRIKATLLLLMLMGKRICGMNKL